MRNCFSDLSVPWSQGSGRVQVATVRNGIHWDPGPFHRPPKPPQWITSPSFYLFWFTPRYRVISCNLAGWVSHPLPSLQPTSSRIKSLVLWGHFKPGTISSVDWTLYQIPFQRLSFVDFPSQDLLTLKNLLFLCPVGQGGKMGWVTAEPWGSKTSLVLLPWKSRPRPPTLFNKNKTWERLKLRAGSRCLLPCRTAF